MIKINLIKKRKKNKMHKEFTSDMRAEEAVPRLEGSMESKVSSRFTAVAGKPLHRSLREVL